jgi:hypothetical protein
VPSPIVNVRVRTRSPVVGFETEDRYRYVTVRKKRVYSSWVGCDSCSALFERKLSVGLTRADVADRLRHGPDVSDQELLTALTRLLPSGEYAVADIHVRPILTVPGDSNDYFSHEAVSLFGYDAGTANAAYWRAGSAQLPPDPGTAAEAHGLPLPRLPSLGPPEFIHPIDNTTGRPVARKLLFHFLIPIDELDAERWMARWEREAEARALEYRRVLARLRSLDHGRAAEEVTPVVVARAGRREPGSSATRGAGYRLRLVRAP